MNRVRFIAHEVPQRRRLKVRCVFCGVELEQIVTDHERVVGTCRTCVYREGQTL